MEQTMSELKLGDTFMCEGEELTIMDSEPKEITNPFSSESCMLCPEAIAVYDYIKGSEYLSIPFSKQLHYFMEKWAEEYMILLD